MRQKQPDVELYALIEAAVNDIEHHGVKGMKWGVRRDLKKSRTHEEKNVKIAAKDGGWRKKVSSTPQYGKIGLRASKSARKEIGELNKQYREEGHKLTRGLTSIKNKALRPNTPSLVKDRYVSDVKKIMENQLGLAAYKIHGNSPSGLFQVNIETKESGGYRAVVTNRDTPRVVRDMARVDKRVDKHIKKDQRAAAKVQRAAAKVQHADSSPVMEFDLPTDEDGYIVDVKPTETAVQHAETFIEDLVTSFSEPEETEDFVELLHDVLSDFDTYLAHHGVKGMKWGVRKDRSGNSAKRITKKTNAKISKQITGRRVKASKSSRSSVNKNRRELSDSELNDLVSRLEKEKKLKTLLDNDVSPGKTFMKSVMTDAGKQALTTVAKGAMLYGVKAALTKEFKPQDLGKAMAKGQA